jgi:electron transport complex protein RnfD
MIDVLIALLFVSICSMVLQYNLYGMTGVIRAFLILIVAVITCNLVDLVYWKLNKVKKKDLFEKISESAPIITGLILGLTLPLGDLNSYMMIYVTIIASIIAELFGKLIYGGFGYNIFNPAAVGRAFALLAFGKYLIIPTIDGLASASPLNSLQQVVSNNDVSSLLKTFDGYQSLLFGSHQGSIGETMVVPLLIAAVYLIARKVIDWRIPVFSLITMFILSSVFSLMSGTYSLDYVMVNVFGGGLVFGAVFMLTDPVTNPISKQGKVIFAIIFTLITFLIRAKASLPEGVIFAILLVNMFVPLIDRVCAGLTNTSMVKKYLSVGLVLVVSIVITILFYYVA